MIGSAGVLFAFYQRTANRKGQTVEEMEYVQIQEREPLKNLRNRYDIHWSVYQIYDDYLDNDMMMTSQVIDIPKKRLTDCQSLLRSNKPFVRKSVQDAYGGPLKTHNHFAEMVMWEMYKPEGVNVFLRGSRSDIYGSGALLIELLWG